MYSKLPNLIFGFHGCSKDTYEKVLHDHQPLRKSENIYDWLGSGIYFWENSYERAYDWAKQQHRDNAAVIGAVLDLGYCLNLTDYHSSQILRNGYDLLKEDCRLSNKSLPINRPSKKASDILLRDLDCAVIQHIHNFNEENNYQKYDSVRGVFIEGGEVFPGACFKEKTHIQICIVNPNFIKGYFAPISMDENYPLP